MRPDLRPRGSVSRASILSGVWPLLMVAARSGFLLRPWQVVTVLVPLVLRHGAGLDTVVQVSARRSGGSTAVIDDLGSTSYDELWSRAMLIARGLVSVVPGAEAASDHDEHARPRACVLVRSRVSPLAAIAGALRAGFEVIPVDSSGGASSLARALRAQKPLVMIADADGLRAVREAGFSGPVIDQDRPPSGMGMRSRRPTRRGRLGLLTSGTTGAPRAIGSPGATLARAGGLAALLLASGVRGRRALLVLTPLHHGHGLSAAVAGILVGGAVVLGHGLRGAALQRILDRHSPVALTLVPTQLVRMLADGVVPPASVRRILSGSAPLSPQHAAAAIDAWGAMIVNAYGSTETGTLTRSTPRQSSREPGTAGRPLPGISIAVTDAAGRPVARGATGEIRVVIAGAGGSRRTHDVGWMSPAGRLHVTSRRDRIVVSGGENVSLSRVEEALVEHPSVGSASAVGEDDPEFGRVVCAVVTLRAGLEPTDAPSPDELRSWLDARVERFEVPKRIVVREPERPVTGRRAAARPSRRNRAS
jgi:acyl-CoA synthetase (AMP-forming)/AMP-acid ligase II